MKKIVLSVDDRHLETVMSILTNLKVGLIDNIQSDEVKKTRKPAYVPKQGKAIDEREKPTGKYLSPSQYRNRPKK